MTFIERFCARFCAGQLQKTEQAILCRMEAMEHRLTMKISELKNEVVGIKAQVTKIWGEQQAKYDALVVEFDTLKASLENAELPADVVQDIVDFKAELKAFDDTIPDVTA